MSICRPTDHGCKSTNILVPSNVTWKTKGPKILQTPSGRAFVPGRSVMENSVVGAANASTFPFMAFQSGPVCDAHPVTANGGTVTATNAGEAAHFAAYFKVGDLIGVYLQKTRSRARSPTAYVTKLTTWPIRKVHLKLLTIQGAVPFEAHGDGQKVWGWAW